MSRESRYSSKLVNFCFSSSRKRSTRYCSDFFKSSWVSRKVGKKSRATDRMNDSSWTGSVGKSGTVTAGRTILTASRSTGLSSIKTKESKPRFNSVPRYSILTGLGSQLALMATKSSSRKSMSGCWRIALNASSILFLDTTANSTPCCFNSRIRRWKFW